MIPPVLRISTSFGLKLSPTTQTIGAIQAIASADTVVVNRFEAEGAGDVVGQGLMRGKAGDQFEGDGLTIAGLGGLRVALGGRLSGLAGHDCDPVSLPGRSRRRRAGVRPLGCGFLGRA
jgi:hypothetical protein